MYAIYILFVMTAFALAVSGITIRLGAAAVVRSRAAAGRRTTVVYAFGGAWLIIVGITGVLLSVNYGMVVAFLCIY